jgi:hypothetical protein
MSLNFLTLHTRVRRCSTLMILPLLVAASAGAQDVAPPNVPANLQVPSGNTLFLKTYAVGTQNYVCLPDGGPNGSLTWKFQGPQATLFVKFKWFHTEVMQQVATHYLSANPTEGGAVARATWMSSADTSAVWAKKISETSDPAYVAAGAIPWLLLQMAGTQRGPTEGTFLAQTTFIQRVNTSGGVAPTGACTEPGQIQFVPYTTDYYFYRAANGK